MVPVNRSCQIPIWLWLVNYLHLHLHLHLHLVTTAPAAVATRAPWSKPRDSTKHGIPYCKLSLCKSCCRRCISVKLYEAAPSHTSTKPHARCAHARRPRQIMAGSHKVWPSSSQKSDFLRITRSDCRFILHRSTHLER